MADFCKQCSEELFGKDFGDLKGLGNGQPLEPGKGWAALCEGCGPTIVDDDGKCTSHVCEKHGEENRKDAICEKCKDPKYRCSCIGGPGNYF